jgi:metal-responsive CopG/Arc/MetJ family transcriptional regulator
MPAKRVLISIQEQLLERVDERAARLGIGRSTYLAKLAAADLEGDRGVGDRNPDARSATRDVNGGGPNPGNA